MATILITGGTGTIGKTLTSLLLQKGYEVIILTRSNGNQKKPGDSKLSYALWDVKRQTIDITAVQNTDYIIHLAGAGVADKRWNKKRKKEIIESRTQSSALLVKALKENSNLVKAVVSISGIGWYGPDPVVPNPKPFTETDPYYNDFLGDTCKQWEESIDPVVQLGKRLVKIRTGIVLSNEGGALKEFINPIKFGIAAILANGKQIVSWIHVDDLCRIFLKAIEDENMIGVYNGVAPKPVTNKALTLELAKAIKNKFYIPIHVPAAVLKIVLGEMSIEVLKSATVSADKLRSTAFNFIYPSVEAAINQLIRKK